MAMLQPKTQTTLSVTNPSNGKTVVLNVGDQWLVRLPTEMTIETIQIMQLTNVTVQLNTFALDGTDFARTLDRFYASRIEWVESLSPVAPAA